MVGSAAAAAGSSFVAFASGAAVVTYGLGRVFGATVG
jgi:hypothetical protein